VEAVIAVGRKLHNDARPIAT